MTKHNDQVYFQEKRHLSLRILFYYLYRVYLLCLSKKKILLFLITTAFLAGLLFAPQTKIAVRIEDLSNPELKSYISMQKLKEDFNFEDKFTLVLKKNSSMDEKDYCLIKNWLQKENNTNPQISHVNSLLNVRSIKYENQLLFYPQIIDSPCEKKINFEVLKNNPLTSMFTTEHLEDFIINFTINPSSENLRHGPYNYQILNDIIQSAKSSLPYEVLSGGTLYFQSSVLEGIEYSEITNLIAAILLFCGYFYLYRTFIGAFTLLFIIYFINSFIKFGMAYFGHMIDPLTSCIFLMLTISAIEDYILLSFLVFKKKLPFQSAIKKLLLPSFLTSLTTSIGFGSLAVSSNQSIVHFSIWTSLGAMLEWVAMFLLLPAAVSMFPKIRRKIETHPIPKSIVPKNIITLTLSKKIACALALLPLILFFIYDRANLNYSPYDMFTKNHPISKFREHLLQTRKTEGELSIVFKNNDFNLEEIISKISQDPSVSKIYSELDLNSYINQQPSFLTKLISEDFKRTDFGKLFFGIEAKRAIVYVNSFDTKDIPRIVQRMEKICKDNCEISSEIIVSKDYALGILKTLYDSALFGFLSIIILISWLVLCTNKKYFIPIIISTLWASFILLILVIIFQFKINVVTCVALSVLIGLAGDNAIQFLLLQEKTLRHSIDDVGEASTENLFLLLLLSSTLFLSYFQTPKTLAFLMMIGIILMLIGDLWVLKGLIGFVDRDKKIVR
jgi:predicted RND superfamily exporter protein